MHAISKCILTIFLAAFAFATPLTLTANAQALPDPEPQAIADDRLTTEQRNDIQPFATSTVPVQDERVGALWVIRDGATEASRECTANHLEGKFWVTAFHCIDDTTEPQRVITQNGTNEIAGVESVYTISNEYDIAILKVGDGVRAEDFQLPTANPKPGDYLNLVGYGGDHDYPSLAEVKITKELDSIPVDFYNFKNVLESYSAGASRTCFGDSGAAIFRDDVLYAVHTGGMSNVECSDLEDSRMIHTPIYPHLEWIEKTLNQYQTSTPEERQTAIDAKKEFQRLQPMSLHPTH